MVSGFRVLGVEALDAKSSDDVLGHLRRIKLSNNTENNQTPYAVVCIIEDLMVGIDEKEYTKVVSGPLPAVVLLPSAKGSQGLAEARLRKLAERAIGASII